MNIQLMRGKYSSYAAGAFLKTTNIALKVIGVSLRICPKI